MAKKLMESLQLEARSEKPCRAEFEFTVPAEAMQAETRGALAEIATQVSLPGFRQGKAPVGMIRTRFGKELKEELERRIFTAAFELLRGKEEYDIVSCGVKEEPELKIDEEFKFTLAADLAPAVELGDYKAIKVELPLEAVTEEAIEERLKMFRTMYGNYAEVEGPAALEDMLKVNYSADLAAPEEANAAVKRQLAADDSYIWLSEPETIPGCIAALTGAEKGKEYTLEAAYPADYREEFLAGKKVNYKVSVLGLQRRVPLNDTDLAARMGAKTVEEMHENLRKMQETENAGKRRRDAGLAVYRRLAEQAGDFALPPGMLEEETHKALQRIAREKVNSEEEAEKFKAEVEEHRKAAAVQAADSLRRTFILRKIAKLENIALEEQEVEDRLQDMSRYYGYSKNEFRSMIEKNGGMGDLELDILGDKVLDRLVDQSLA